MKKVLLLVGLVILIGSASSCKKSYSCECKTTYTDGNGDPWQLTKIEPIDEKMKNKQASAACKTTAAQMKVVNNDLNNDPTGPYYDITTTCTVK